MKILIPQRLMSSIPLLARFVSIFPGSFYTSTDMMEILVPPYLTMIDIWEHFSQDELKAICSLLDHKSGKFKNVHPGQLALHNVIDVIIVMKNSDSPYISVEYGFKLYSPRALTVPVPIT